jgi:uncharacterized membrane protein
MYRSSLLLAILILLSILIFFILVNVVTFSYSELGLSQTSAIVLLIATLLGAMINIPITTRQIKYQEPQSFLSRFFFYTPPKVVSQTIAINVGGALIPIGFSIYLLFRALLLPTLVVSLVVILIVRLLSRPVPGTGITVPAFIPPLVSAGLALLLARAHPAPVAYISGTIGTLIGGDLLNWPNFKKLGSHMISIGGAGVFDGVFLAGILAVLITTI